MLVESMAGRDKAESAHEESEKRFRATFEHAAVGIALISPDGHWMSTNNKMCEIVGYSSDELATLTFKDVTHPDDLKLQLAHVDQMVAGEIESYSLEKRYIRKGGDIAWINLTVALVRKTDGSPDYFISIVEDINARKQAQAALQAREANLSEAQRLAHLGNWTWDVTSNVHTWSIELYNIYGRDPKLPPAIYPEVKGYFPDASWSALSTHIEHCLENGTPYQCDAEIIRGDGTRGWITVRGEASLDASSKVVELHGTVQDITDRKQTEHELAAHREKLEELVGARTRELAEANRSLVQHAAEITDLYDRAPCGYHSLTGDGIVVAVNETELGMLGYSREEFVGHHIHDFMTAESRALFHRRFPEFKRTGEVRDLDFDFVRKDGTVLPVLVSGYLLRGRDGSFLASRATMVDNSEGKARALQIAEMQTELARRAEAAELATQAKSDFLANMSHEIRTPMNAIIGLTELASRSAIEDAQKEQLRKVKFAARHLLQILNDILDLSKIEAGKLQISERKFLLKDLFNDAMTLIADKAEAKGLMLRHEIDPALEDALAGDALRIAQILINFASNAVKFTEHGSIAFRARLIREDAQGLVMHCEVADTGIGIETASLDRLFDAFEQADSSTARRFGGTGLGLAISRRLAALMGGEAGAQSTLGAGSTFWFTVRIRRGADLNPTLPLAQGGNAAAEEILRDRFGAARILLTEDNMINQEVALGLLAVTQLQVDVAGSGEEAIAMASTVQYDLILMDVQMPGMDGLEATRILRSLPAYANTPILAMTAAAFQEDRARCIEAGMNDHVSKPVMPDALFRTLLVWLTKRSAQPTDSVALL
jgi:PAS domain S-box-containing protein